MQYEIKYLIIYIKIALRKSCQGTVLVKILGGCAQAPLIGCNSFLCIVGIVGDSHLGLWKEPLDLSFVV